MPKYRMWASYGWVGTTVDNGVYEADDEYEAEDEAKDLAYQRVDYWVELVEGEE